MTFSPANTRLYQAGLDSGLDSPSLVEYISAKTQVWQPHVVVCNKWHAICACVRHISKGLKNYIQNYNLIINFQIRFISAHTIL